MVVNFDVLVHQQHLKETEIVNYFPKDEVWASGVSANELRNYYKSVLPIGEVKVDGVDNGPVNGSRS